MATVQDLRRRIKSVTNTRKITKAMELVASARLRRAQTRIEAMRPFADRMMELMVGTARASSSVHGLPLLQRRETKTVAILPLTGDRGLAGSFNAQVLRHAFAIDRSARAEGQTVRWLVAGRKGASTLRFRHYEVDQAWTGFSDRPAYSDAQALANRLAELYVEVQTSVPLVAMPSTVAFLAGRRPRNRAERQCCCRRRRNCLRPRPIVLCRPRCWRRHEGPCRRCRAQNCRGSYREVRSGKCGRGWRHRRRKTW